MNIPDPDYLEQHKPGYVSDAASLHEQAEERVYTNDLDALEALIVEGLPPDEMQAAAWVLVQRVRGLQADLVRVEKARAAWAARAAR